MKKLVPWGRPRSKLWHHVGLISLLLVVAFVVLAVGRQSAMAGDEAAPVRGKQMVWQVADLPAPASPGAGQAFPAATQDPGKTFLPYIKRNVTPAPKNLFGVQLDETEPDLAAKTAEAGAGWIRVIFRWYSVEPNNTTPDQFQWSAQLDAWLAQLAEQNIHVIFTLTGNPDWAATYRSGVLDRTDPGELAQFLGAAVARYSVPPYNVRYWEMYNEPDNGDESWATIGVGYWGNEPEAYAQMLATVYPAMKAANPNVQVMFGGIAYDMWPEDGGPFVKDFLDKVLQHNGGPYFDVMNFHYYNRFDARWAPYGPGLVGKTNFLRDKLAYYGLNKPFLCTETAMVSDAAHNGSDELQSRYIVQAFSRGLAAHLDATVWFALVDQVEYWKSGLLYLDLTPKPALTAYQTMVKQLGGVNFVRALAPSELGAVSIEAYAFVEPRTSTQLITAWSVDDLDHQIRVAASKVTIVDKYGVETVRRDGDDGRVDNVVHLTVGPSPVYLRYSVN